VGALKETLGFPERTVQGMHTDSLRRLPKDLTCRINMFSSAQTGQAFEQSTSLKLISDKILMITIK